MYCNCNRCSSSKILMTLGYYKEIVFFLILGIFYDINVCYICKIMKRNNFIMMYGGFLKYAQDIVVGDRLMGLQNLPLKVQKIMKEERKCYKIIQDHESIYEIAEDHTIMLLDELNNPVDMCIKDYNELSNEVQKTLFGYKKSTNFTQYNVPQDSYSYGYMLNTGSDEDLIKIYNDYLFNHSVVRSKVIGGMLDASLYIKKGVVQGMFIMFCNSLGIECIFEENSNLLKQLIIPNNHNIHTFKTGVLCYKDNNYLKCNIKVVESDVDEVYFFQLNGKVNNIFLGDFTVAQSM